MGDIYVVDIMLHWREVRKRWLRVLPNVSCTWGERAGSNAVSSHQACTAAVRDNLRILDSYVRRDLRVSQHTLDRQMAAVSVAGILDFVFFANTMGGTVVSARPCDSWLACCQGSLAHVGTVRG